MNAAMVRRTALAIPTTTPDSILTAITTNATCDSARSAHAAIQTAKVSYVALKVIQFAASNVDVTAAYVRPRGR
jgi:hypothetical protein